MACFPLMDYARRYATSVFSAIAGITSVAGAQPQIAKPTSSRGDEFAWLENVRDSAVIAWIKSQDTATRRYLDSLPARARVIDRQRQYVLPEVAGVPLVRGGRTFRVRLISGSPPALLVRSSAGEERQVTAVPFPPAFPGWLPSRDGKRIALFGGRDGSWRILDVDDARASQDTLRGIAATSLDLAWSHDGQGIYYVRQDAPSDPFAAPGDPVAYYHRLGTPQSADTEVFRAPAGTLRVAVGDDGQYLFLTTVPRSAADSRIHAVSLDQASSNSPNRPRSITPPGRALHTFLGNDGAIAYLLTTLGSPRGRIVAVDVSAEASAPSKWKTVVPEGAHAIVTAQMIGNRFVLTQSIDARLSIRIHSLDGTFEREAEWPGLGSSWVQAAGSPGFASTSRNDPVAYFAYISANSQPQVYALDVSSGRLTPHFQPKLAYRSDDFAVEHHVARGRDGTRVPIFIAYKRDTPRDGTAPALVDAVPVSRTLPLSNWGQNTMLMLEMGAVYAFIGGRGGGEYGEAWHQAGSGVGKTLAVDDYLAGIEWLVANRYIRRGRIAAISSGAASAVVTSAVNRHPDWFAAVAMSSPVTDIVNLSRYPGGDQLADDFGTVSGLNRREAERLLRAHAQFSPYDNLRDGVCYPAMLVTAGERDAVAYPAHAYKYVARVQAKQRCDNPVLLQVAWGQGFVGFGSNFADQVAFCVRELALPVDRLVSSPTTGSK